MANEQDKQRRRRERESKTRKRNKRKLISISSSLIEKYIPPTLFIDKVHYRLSIPESTTALNKLRTNPKIYSANSGVTAWLE